MADDSKGEGTSGGSAKAAAPADPAPPIPEATIIPAADGKGKQRATEGDAAGVQQDGDIMDEAPRPEPSAEQMLSEGVSELRFPAAAQPEISRRPSWLLSCDGLLMDVGSPSEPEGSFLPDRAARASGYSRSHPHGYVCIHGSPS